MSACFRLFQTFYRPFAGESGMAELRKPLPVVDREGLLSSAGRRSPRCRRAAPAGDRRRSVTDGDLRRNLVRKNELKGRFCGDGSRRGFQRLELRNVLE